MVGLEVEVNGVVIGPVAAGSALDAVIESLVAGDVVVLRAVEAGHRAAGRERPLELKRRGSGKGAPGPRFAPLEVVEILRWADAHYARTGSWPIAKACELIPEAPDGLRWNHVDAALRLGLRGLTGGSSLARLLASARGVRNRKGLPALTTERILAWADAHRERTGQWPKRTSGAVAEALGETWQAVDMALIHGLRGLAGGSSLQQLFAAQRGVRHRLRSARLTVEQILEWADAHHAATGSWPTLASGEVSGVPGEVWSSIQQSLTNGRRGLPGGSSLARLLASERGMRNRMALPALSEAAILEWARAHHERTGQWPNSRSGEVAEAPGERWSGVDAALRSGARGLPGGSSLARMLR